MTGEHRDPRLASRTLPEGYACRTCTRIATGTVATMSPTATSTDNVDPRRQDVEPRQVHDLAVQDERELDEAERQRGERELRQHDAQGAAGGSTAARCACGRAGRSPCGSPWSSSRLFAAGPGPGGHPINTAQET